MRGARNVPGAYGFAGLKAGNRRCVYAARWPEAADERASRRTARAGLEYHMPRRSGPASAP